MRIGSGGEIESQLRRLEHNGPPTATSPADTYRLGRFQAFIEQDCAARREVRHLGRHIDELLDCQGTSLRDEPCIGIVSAATLLCEVSNPRRFDRESKFARWRGTAAVALSSGEGSGLSVKHCLDFRGIRRVNSILLVASVIQAPQQLQATAYLARKTTGPSPTTTPATRPHKGSTQ